MNTVIPNINQAGFTQRLVKLVPQQWYSDAAKQPGGVLWALLNAVGGQTAFVQGVILYAFNATRIGTATDTALDYCSQDYFGSNLPRYAGETDPAYRVRILAALFNPALTTPAISNAIKKITGTAPIISEPWNIYTTGAYDYTTFYNVNIVPGAPGVYGNNNYAFQAFVTAQLPMATGGSTIPIFAYNYTGYYSTNYSYYITTPSGVLNTTAQLDALINGLKAAGVIIWRQYVTGQLALASIVSGSFYYTSGVYNYPIGYSTETPYALIAEPSWSTTIAATPFGNSSFNLSFGTVPSGASNVDCMLGAITEPNVFLTYVAAGTTNVVINIPAGYSISQLYVQPSWQTTYYISSSTSDTVTVTFGSASPAAAAFGYIFDSSGSAGLYPVPEYATTLVVPVSATGAYKMFVLPYWSTKTWVVKGSSSATVYFSVAAPADAECNIEWRTS